MSKGILIAFIVVSTMPTLTARPIQSPPPASTPPTSSTIHELVIPDLEYSLIPIRRGSFLMGDPEIHNGWKGQSHEVTIQKPFWIGKYEVTQSVFHTILGKNPSTFDKPRTQGWQDRPVETVTWEETQEFCRQLNIRWKDLVPTGYEFRLPTEAEWEYVARAAHSDNAPNAFVDLGSKVGTVEVGKTIAQATNIHGLFGNVMEWCQDWYGQYPTEHVADPAGPHKGYCRVVRGGSWLHSKDLATPTYRNNFAPETRSCFIGFRIVLAPKIGNAGTE